MANFTITVTNNGLSLLTRALAGEEIKVTGMALGDGIHTGSLSDTEALVSEKLTLPIDALTRSGNKLTVKSTLSYNMITAGFIWTEVGLMAKDPDGGADILYAYGYAGEKGDYIPASTEATLNEKILRLTVMASSEAQITAEVADTIYASAEDLEKVVSVVEQVTGTDLSGPSAAEINGSMVVTLTHEKIDTVHTYTGLGDKDGLVPAQFFATGAYTAGDTATIDGEDYTIVLTGADEPDTGLFVSGRAVQVAIDTESKTVNFKSGGGLSNGKLALATATEGTVLLGYSFYAGDKTLKEGTYDPEWAIKKYW